ncbi:hypothetical protein T4B_2270 [Trichinella pseudospiralis]|uniref:Uncharacterized protein n=1 Tax=Trichinella pseudospiralis TaxID=6337 RepID=A0A0V1KDT8_TRIPS|nr:hypothetical protein T4B_2270 [Trichinella pseudospiralis]KRZ45379.1 hypothetical protein T4C_6077 [Trichinella pseudospiralis]
MLLIRCIAKEFLESNAVERLKDMPKISENRNNAKYSRNLYNQKLSKKIDDLCVNSEIYVANGHYSSQRKPCCPWPPPRCRTGVSTAFHADQENEQDNRSGFILTFSLCGHTYVHAEDWKGWTSHNKENHCYGNYFQIRRVTILLLNVMNNSERIYLEFLCVPTICGVPAKLELNAWQHLRNSMNSPAHQLFPDNEEQCESVVRKPTFSKCVKLTEQSTLFSKEAAHFNPQKDKLQTFKNIALGDSSTKT